MQSTQHYQTALKELGPTTTTTEIKSNSFELGL